MVVLGDKSFFTMSSTPGCAQHSSNVGDPGGGPTSPRLGGGGSGLELARHGLCVAFGVNLSRLPLALLGGTGMPVGIWHFHIARTAKADQRADRAHLEPKWLREFLDEIFVVHCSQLTYGCRLVFNFWGKSSQKKKLARFQTL